MGRERGEGGRVEGGYRRGAHSLCLASHTLIMPSLSLSPFPTSFYYLKSYVEGTGVVHLAAGIV